MIPTLLHSMHSNQYSLLKQKLICFCCFLLLVQIVLAHDSRGHHSRIARQIKSHNVKQDAEPRKTKFSKRGPLGIQSHDKSTAKINGVYIGMIPDAGDTGGTSQTMAEITRSLKGKKPGLFGWYAQVSSKVPFDGSQLFEVWDDLKKCNCVFAPAIMPIDGWDGLRWNDNKQAVRIAKVLRKFTDADIPVSLRFAHEVNWYQRTKECPGDARDFKEGWDVVATAVRTYCPDCFLHWSPNVATMEEYKKYAPLNMNKTVDVVGLDYYPPKKAQQGEFINKVKEFYDTYAVNGRMFGLGETGLHYAASYSERVEWLCQITESKKQFPNLIFAIWYNSKKEWDYKLAGNGVSTALLTEKLE